MVWMSRTAGWIRHHASCIQGARFRALVLSQPIVNNYFCRTELETSMLVLVWQLTPPNNKALLLVPPDTITACNLQGQGQQQGQERQEETRSEGTGASNTGNL